MKAKKLYFMECHLAGRKYHDVDLVWDDLTVGTKVRLVREPDNRYDANAVAIVYDKNEGDETADEYLLGYIPSKENEVIARFLDMGWDECFSCTISRKNPEAQYEEQIRLTVRINKNEEQNKRSSKN